MIASSPALSTGIAPTATPLSPDQQRLWVLTRLAPVSSIFQVGLTLKAQGPLQVQALDEARKIASRTPRSATLSPSRNA